MLIERVLVNFSEEDTNIDTVWKVIKTVFPIIMSYKDISWENNMEDNIRILFARMWPERITSLSAAYVAFNFVFVQVDWTHRKQWRSLDQPGWDLDGGTRETFVLKMKADSL